MISIARVLLSAGAAAAVLSAVQCKNSATTTTTTTTTKTTTAVTTTTTAGAFPSIPAVVISGNIPSKVPIPSSPPNPTPEQVRPYFDWFSWESFIALNWPASSTGRGNPNQPDNPSIFTSMTNTTPVTWGTYKANWELYTQYDKRPTPWDSYAVAYGTGCPSPQPGSKQLVQVAKIQELGDTMQAFSVPLVDQRSKYVYYEVDYNQAYYDFVRGSDADPSTWLYLGKNLPTDYTVVCLPPNTQPGDSGNSAYPCKMMTTAKPSDSIMIKAAWRLLTGVPAAQAKRYYTVNAWVLDGVTQKCTQQPVGLVGLHIAQKTADFPEWIWSTFEQVDNVPPQADGVPSSFNNGTNNPSTGNMGFANPGQYDPNHPGRPAPNPTPTQVVRVNPIPTTPAGSSTVDVNNTFHSALPKTSVWQYYQLVITQWPSNPGQFKPGAQRGVYPQGAGAAFPANGAVNTALETYFQTATNAQGAFGNSCMSCHFAAASGTRDFSWGFARRPHSDQPPPQPSTK